MPRRKNKGKQRADEVIRRQEPKIHSDTKTLIKDLPSIIKEGIKKPGNILNLSIIGFAAVCNAILAHTSLTVSFILAGISCLQPAVTDFSYNYKLIKNELLKNKDLKTFQDKALEITKFIWPGIVAVVVGALFFGLHIRLYNQGAEIMSSVLLAVGTFVAGSAQMLVKPMIKREVARKNPPAPMVGEREILISPAIQAAEELEQEITSNAVSDQLKQFNDLFTTQNDNLKTKTSILIQNVNAQQKEIVCLRQENNNLQVNNKTLTEQLDKTEETTKQLSQINEQLTEELEEKQNKIEELQGELRQLKGQPIQEEIAVSNSKSKSNNANLNNEISVITR
ncbi:hypothetical protein NOVO_01265 [Rickettsiales bacterium Ac37b]|nr:hypothetical protein NOVO_01265 [Rickettsiales bacterium Ac37b]